MVKIEFLGGADRVTGSCHKLTLDSKTLLIDCGVRQEEGLSSEEALELPVEEPVDYCILTHAHLDHSGLLPILLKRKKLRAQVVSTSATKILSEILLKDFMNIYRSERGSPPFTEQDLERLFSKWTVVDYGKKVTLFPSTAVRLFNAAHILGSSSVQVIYNRRGEMFDIFFSGDIGTSKSMLMDYPPQKPGGASYVVCESTYGGKVHRDNREDAANFVRDVIKNGGKVLIPAFSVGRSQEVIYFLNKSGINCPIYLDSPMSLSVTRLSGVFEPFLRFLPDLGKNLFDGFIPVESAKESKKLAASDEPCVIVSASGMLTGGRVVQHFESIKDNEKHAIMFVGYQAKGTLGRKILDGEVNVSCRVFVASGFSAHADGEELKDYLKGFRRIGDKVFLVHGEENERNALLNELRKEGFNAVAPNEGESFELRATSVKGVGRITGRSYPYERITVDEFLKEAAPYLSSECISRMKIKRLMTRLSYGRESALVWLKETEERGALCVDRDIDENGRKHAYRLLQRAAVWFTPEDFARVLDFLKTGSGTR